MLDLVLLAKENATTPERQDLLDGLMEDSESLVMRTMEQSIEHANLLGDDFFAPLMALAATMGSRNFWRAMGNWGYGFHSPLSTETYASNTLDVGSWAAQFVALDRLDDLLESGLFTPFSNRQPNVGLMAWEIGMMGKEDDRFLFWVDKWSEQVALEYTQAKGCSMMPSIPAVLGVMEQVVSHGKPPSEAWPSLDVIERRMVTFIDRFIDTHYQAVDGDAQLQAILQTPPISRNARLVAKIVARACCRAANPFQGDNLVDRAMDRKMYAVAAGLIDGGAPLFTGTGVKDPSDFLATMKNTQNKEINLTWRAWLARARAKQPHVIDVLPSYLRREEGDYQQWISQDPDRAKRTVEAVSMAYRTGPAKGPRTRANRL